MTGLLAGWDEMPVPAFRVDAHKPQPWGVGEAFAFFAESLLFTFGACRVFCHPVTVPVVTS